MQQGKTKGLDVRAGSRASHGTGDAVSAVPASIPDAVEWLHTRGIIDDRMLVAAATVHAAFRRGDAQRWLDDAGPGMSDIVWQVVCVGKLLPQAERDLGWPHRSGKLILRMALARIAAAQGGEARQGGDSAASSVHEHPVPEGDAPDPQGQTTSSENPHHD